MNFSKTIKHIDFSLGLLSKQIKKGIIPSQQRDKVLDNIGCGQDTVYECENKEDLYNGLQTLNSTLKDYIVSCHVINVQNFYNDLIFNILDYITSDNN